VIHVAFIFVGMSKTLIRKEKKKEQEMDDVDISRERLDDRESIRSPLRSSRSSLSTLIGAVDQASRMTLVGEEKRIALRDDLEVRISLALDAAGSISLRLEHISEDLSARSLIAVLSLSHTITNANELSIDVFETSTDRILNGLLDLLLDETSSERTDGLVKELVLGIADGELEGVDLDVDIFDVEDG